MHRDIKPENFILAEKNNKQSEVKMIDFGLAKILTKPDQIMKKTKGSPFYIAPEVLKNSYTMKCDVWSMGVLMYVMLMGKYPFHASSTDELFDNIKTE